ncbi:hypothetical protein M408DRAFT_263466 [Serendipita vermifera MAFF 305830]|uniref:Nephrocystin 3-like N-terminal domain-containing protein n=1 Tax=Serendipita vermifera MAFF 305830 TaxID=933852 RepID=A0A0C3AVY3_SERVB|nr:hypothetical protein M408DRAFT_263466 [Serendipita vermifera MAFF 305830]
MGNCISKDHGKDADEVLTTVVKVAASQVVNSNPKQAPAPLKSNILASERPDMNIKDEVYDPEKTAAALEMGIQVVDLFQKAAKVTEMVIPSPLGEVLEKVTKVLGVLKQMVENRKGWRHLLNTIDEHQKTFNDQLQRLKADNSVPDPDSPLLEPVKQYSEKLETFAAKIMAEGGLVKKDAPESTAWEKIKTFTSRALSAEDEKGSMDGYLKQLATAMDQFRFMLEIFVGFTVDEVKKGVDSLALDVRAIGNDVKDVRTAVMLNAEPKDGTNAANITPFGVQHKTCLQGTRIQVLEEIRVWARPKETPTPVYCIGDVAGTGKSTISRTMYDEWSMSKQKTLAFFFSREGAATQTATDFCFFIGEQIRVAGGPEIKEYWSKLEPGLVLLRQQPVQQQWTRLVYEPLCLLPNDGPLILIIDALDECTKATRADLLKCALNACTSGMLPQLRLYITTRNEADIVPLLQNDAYEKNIVHKSLLGSSSAKEDVGLYVSHRLDEINAFMSDSKPRSLLIERCGGLFIFAFLACKLLEDAYNENEPLDSILHSFTSLDVLYHQTLSRADNNIVKNREQLKNILQIIVIAQEPLSITAISDLLPSNASTNSVKKAISNLGSLLASREIDDPVYILHATFTEFLLRQNWVATSGMSVPNEYAIGRAQANRAMTRGCLANLLRARRPDQVQTSMTAIQYAAIRWVSHVIQEVHSQEIRDMMQQFYQEKLLDWIALGGITASIPGYMTSIAKLGSTMKRCQQKIQGIIDQDIEWLKDILDFLRLNQPVLQKDPFGVYSSALLFSPRDNLVYRHYAGRYQDTWPRILTGSPASSSNSVVLGSSPPCTAAFSSTGALMASASEIDNKVRIWDTQTWAELLNFNVETAPNLVVPASLTFLPDDKVVISVWDDGSFYKHNFESGGTMLSHFQDCPSNLLCATGGKGNEAICGFKEGQICGFSLQDGKMIGGVLQAHDGEVSELFISKNGTALASICADKTIKVWKKTSMGLDNVPLCVWNHSEAIQSGQFSPSDNSLFAFTDQGAIHILNINTGAIEATKESPGARKLTYSPNGDYIATEQDGGRSVQLWQTTSATGATPIVLKTGQTEELSILLFTPDMKSIVTSTLVGTFRVNDITAQASGPLWDGHQDRVQSVQFTRNDKLVGTFAVDKSFCLWDVETGKLIQGPDPITLDIHHSTACAFDGTTLIHHRRDIAKFFDMKRLKTFGPTLTITASPQPNIWNLVISPTEPIIAIYSTDYTKDRSALSIFSLETSSTESKAVIEPELGMRVQHMGFHPSGKYIGVGKKAWSIVSETPVELSGDELQAVLEDISPGILQLDVDDNNVASITLGSPVRQVFNIPTYLNVRMRHDIRDGFLVTGSSDGRVIIFDFNHLLTVEEKAHFDRIRLMREEAASKLGPSRLYEILSAYQDPPVTTPEAK